MVHYLLCAPIFSLTYAAISCLIAQHAVYGLVQEIVVFQYTSAVHACAWKCPGLCGLSCRLAAMVFEAQQWFWKSGMVVHSLTCIVEFSKMDTSGPEVSATQGGVQCIFN